MQRNTSNLIGLDKVTIFLLVGDEMRFKFGFEEDMVSQLKSGRKLPSGKVWLHIAGSCACWNSMSCLMERFW